MWSSFSLDNGKAQNSFVTMQLIILRIGRLLQKHIFEIMSLNAKCKMITSYTWLLKQGSWRSVSRGSEDNVV